MELTHCKRLGFSHTPLHRRLEPHALHFLTQRTSFWIAVISVMAFVMGNMIGQHGWYAFWKSVLGMTDDSSIVYSGTVTPLELVPDYTLWSRFGGDPSVHTFRQVPSDALRPLPRYVSAVQRDYSVSHGLGSDVYSVSYLGSYDTGTEGMGSHPGVDIRTPVGTPVRSVAAGIVERSGNLSGFGKVVVIRHPNVPDPDDTRKMTTLYSVYAHLSALYVTEGAVVQKGEHIADSGMTGSASGPHLHFQMDRESAPWHPYWPFSDAEARSEGLTASAAVNSVIFQSQGSKYTVNPLLYVQANYAPAKSLIVQDASATSSSSSAAAIKIPPKERFAARLQARLEKAKTKNIAVVRRPVVTAPAVIESRETVATTLPETVLSNAKPSAHIASVEITHRGSYTGRSWEKIRLRLLDQDGNTVKSPDIPMDLYFRTAFGSAEFKPAILSTLDFVNGEAFVDMLPHGQRTVVVLIQPFNIMSEPMTFER
ncbi:MAG: M23 family metallopeptidase [Candidatus Peregrinibacteria bacterium]